jgi:hypothetical protein
MGMTNGRFRQAVRRGILATAEATFRNRMTDPANEQPSNLSEDAKLRATSPRLAPAIAGLGVLVLLAGACYLWLDYVRYSRERRYAANNLKEIGLAIRNYEEVHGELPNNSYAHDGKSLLSWRVHLLPYMEHDNIYRQFKFDEPWDSPSNLLLLNCGVPPYTNWGGTLTYYRGFSSPGAVFERRSNRLGFSSFKDQLHETIMVVEAAEPVEWTKPDDLDASPEKPFPVMGGIKYRRKVFQALFADMTVRPLRLDTPESTLGALVTHSGGETLPPGWDD